MYSYNARYASFTPPLRPKSSSKGNADLRWPHPASYLATPASLASAGFYFNPSVTTPDAVSCFICDKALAFWDPEDHPAQIHSQKCPKCPWAMLKCATDANGSLKLPTSRLPSPRVAEKARLATFGPEGKRWWPHDARNKGPTSKIMAKAGFIYVPVNNKDDTCECIHCGIELAGWEPEDDPMEEHRSRQAKKGPCPFFVSSNDISESTKRPRSKSKQPRSKSKQPRSKSKPPPTTHIASSSDQEYRPPETRSSTRLSSSKQSGGTPQLQVESTHDPGDISAVSTSLSKSFRSPEDEEFAREEQALEEQARQLMLTDATFSLASGLPYEEKSYVANSQHEIAQDELYADPQSAPPLDKGKGKVKASTAEGSMITNADALSLVTPTTPSRTPPIAKSAEIPSVVKIPQLLPEDSVATLTNVERAMTVEQWIRYEMDREYERLKSDGRQKIEAFKARAIEVAKQIERL